MARPIEIIGSIANWSILETMAWVATAFVPILFKATWSVIEPMAIILD